MAENFQNWWKKTIHKYGKINKSKNKIKKKKSKIFSFGYDGLFSIRTMSLLRTIIKSELKKKTPTVWMNCSTTKQPELVEPVFQWDEKCVEEELRFVCY